MVDLSGQEGQLDEYEVVFLKSLFSLNELIVKDVIIYCIQVFLVLEDMMVEVFFYKYSNIEFF